jgi:5'-nucleotidase
VDIIIGGHSHTILTEPARVNNILIAQAGVGTNQIGRFDITVDDDTNSIVDWKWELIPIDNEHAEPDKRLQEYIESFKSEVDRKYNTVICKLTDELTHPKREIETALGNLFADAFAETGECDAVLVGSGSIRGQSLGPVVTLKDFRTIFPYDDCLTRFNISGAELKRIFAHIMRPENRNGEGECYQVNGRLKVVYNDNLRELESLTFNGRPLTDDQRLTLGVMGYHVNNCANYLNITEDELRASGNTKVVTTSAQEVLEEYLKNHQNIGRKVEGRLTWI